MECKRKSYLHTRKYSRPGRKYFQETLFTLGMIIIIKIIMTWMNNLIIPYIFRIGMFTVRLGARYWFLRIQGQTVRCGLFWTRSCWAVYGQTVAGKWILVRNGREVDHRTRTERDIEMQLGAMTILVLRGCSEVVMKGRFSVQ